MKKIVNLIKMSSDKTESERKSVMHERRIERNDSKFAADEDVCI